MEKDLNNNNNSDNDSNEEQSRFKSRVNQINNSKYSQTNSKKLNQNQLNEQKNINFKDFLEKNQHEYDSSKVKPFSAEFILNFSKNNDKDLSLVSRDLPKYFNKYKLSIFDIKFKNRTKEDELYSKKEEYFKYIRRGNCIMRCEKSTDCKIDANKSVYYKIIRKGLPKFFDYSPIYSKNTKNSLTRVVGKINDNFKNKERCKPILVYMTYKANGENLQISYLKEFDSWVICSKNVSLLVNSEKDLEEFEGVEQFSFAVYFARLWFKKLRTLFGNDTNISEESNTINTNSNINNSSLIEFKNTIDGYTLVGESVGDPDHQHIKVYKEPDFMFYALVKNNNNENDNNDDVENDESQLPCLNFEYSHNIFKRFGLTTVPYEKSPLLNTKEEFDKYMNEIYTKVLHSSVEEYGEGQVCYFCKVNKISNSNEVSKTNIEVLSLGKLKTFEYRFFRKLREKLKSFVKANKEISNVLNAIKRESNDILDNTKEELIDISSYLKFAEFVLLFVKRNNIKHDLSDHFGGFILECKKAFALKYPSIKLIMRIKNNDKEKDLISNDIDSSISNNFNKNNNDLELDEDKSSEIKQAYQILNQFTDKININKTSNIIDNTNTKQDSKITHLPINIINDLKPLNSKNIYLIITLGIVGSGKSTVFNSLKNQIYKNHFDNYDLESVSSDGLQQDLYQEMLKENPSLTFEEAFNTIKEKIKNKFNSEVLKHISNYNNSINTKNNNNKKIHFLYLDKNFPITQLSANIKPFISSSDNIKVIVFYPNIPNSKAIPGSPYSFNYIAQCYFRIRNRKHETLDSEKKKNFYVILFFFLALNKGKVYDFDSSLNFKREFGYFPINMTDEDFEVYESSDEYYNAYNSLIKIINMSNKVLFNDELFEKTHKKDISTLVDYYERMYEEYEKKIGDKDNGTYNKKFYSSTVDIIDEQICLCKLVLFIIY